MKSQTRHNGQSPSDKVQGKTNGRGRSNGQARAPGFPSTSRALAQPAQEKPRYGPGSGGCTGRGFLPGKSGNENGRPRGTRFDRMLRAFMAQEAPPRGDGSRLESVGECIVAKLCEAAVGGNIDACKFIITRLDGKILPAEPSELIDMSTAGLQERISTMGDSYRSPYRDTPRLMEALVELVRQAQAQGQDTDSPHGSKKSQAPASK